MNSIQLKRPTVLFKTIVHLSDRYLLISFQFWGYIIKPNMKFMKLIFYNGNYSSWTPSFPEGFFFMIFFHCFLSVSERRWGRNIILLSLISHLRCIWFLFCFSAMPCWADYNSAQLIWIILADCIYRTW